MLNLGVYLNIGKHLCCELMGKVLFWIMNRVPKLLNLLHSLYFFYSSG